MTDPSTPAHAIQFGVQWTPRSGEPRVETTPMTEELAQELAQSMGGSQALFDHEPDAIVVYRRGPGDKWSTTRPAELAPRAPRKTTDELLQECLDQLADPSNPPLVDEPTFQPRP
ncbi:hypothetical protein [Streptosporangium sp. CA-115845]|uniref:hypothetical protein n=1 Tax=Streptosporangium sp. CA-115845 TaxID=3240071 RepID=UPI003D91E1E3